MTERARVRGPAALAARRVLAAGAALLLVAGAAAACTGGQPAGPDRLVIAAGGEDDVYRLLGEALGEAARDAWSAEVTVTQTDGSVENLQRVAEGRADIGFATVDTAAEAISGSPPFGTALPIRALAQLYEDYLQVVTLAGSGIDELSDLAGRRVSIGATTSGTDLLADRVLHTERVTPGDRKDLNPNLAARALVAGEIDAFFVVGGLPTRAVADLAEPQQPPVQLLTMPDLAGALQAQFGEYYHARSIPAVTYGMDAEVATVTVPNVLVVREDLPEQTAYELTRLLFDAKSELVAAHVEARRLDHRSALATFPIELHPGARRYYRDQKPLALG